MHRIMAIIVRDSSWPHSIGALTSGQHEAVLG
jgi:hypothetical protein